MRNSTFIPTLNCLSEYSDSKIKLTSFVTLTSNRINSNDITQRFWFTIFKQKVFPDVDDFLKRRQTVNIKRMLDLALALTATIGPLVEPNSS